MDRRCTYLDIEEDRKRKKDMTKEQVLIKHIQDYLDSGMYQFEACYLNKEDLKLTIKALKQIDTLNMIRNDLEKNINFLNEGSYFRDGLEEALNIINRNIRRQEEQYEH